MPLREVVGNLWDYPCTMRVITTNGFLKKPNSDGVRCAVMGAGIAKQAAQRYPNLPEVLGRCIQAKGNHVCAIRHDMIAFPVKHNWWEKADLGLIGQSAAELLELTRKMGYKLVALPRPGCGNGQLRWGEVKPVLEEVLGDDEHYIVVDNG